MTIARTRYEELMRHKELDVSDADDSWDEEQQLSVTQDSPSRESSNSTSPNSTSKSPISISPLSRESKTVPASYACIPKNEFDLISPDGQGGWEINESYEGLQEKSGLANLKSNKDKYKEKIAEYKKKSVSELLELAKKLTPKDKVANKVLYAQLVIKSDKKNKAQAFRTLAENIFSSAKESTGENAPRKLIPLLIYSIEAVKLDDAEIALKNPISKLAKQYSHIVRSDLINAIIEKAVKQAGSVGQLQKALENLLEEANLKMSKPELSESLKARLADFHQDLNAESSVDVDSHKKIFPPSEQFKRQIEEIAQVEKTFHEGFSRAVKWLKRLNDDQYKGINGLIALYTGLIENPFQKMTLQKTQDALNTFMEVFSSPTGILNIDFIKRAAVSQERISSQLVSLQPKLAKDKVFCALLRAAGNLDQRISDQDIVKNYIANLLDVVITPVQIVPRYVLLFKEVLKQNSFLSNYEKEKLSELLALTQSIGNEINAQVGVNQALKQKRRKLKKSNLRENLASPAADSALLANEIMIAKLQTENLRLAEQVGTLAAELKEVAHNVLDKTINVPRVERTLQVEKTNADALAEQLSFVQREKQKAEEQARVLAKELTDLKKSAEKTEQLQQWAQEKSLFQHVVVGLSQQDEIKSIAESKDSAEEIAHCIKDVVSELKVYISIFKLKLFGHHHNNLAVALKDKVRSARSLAEIKNLLLAEHQLIAPKVENVENSGYLKSITAALDVFKERRKKLVSAATLRK